MRLRDIRAISKRVKGAEREFVRDLLHSEEPRQAIIAFEIFAYFPEAYIDHRFRDDLDRFLDAGAGA